MRFATPILAIALLLAALSGCGGSSGGSGSTTSPGAGSSTSPAGASVHACPLSVGGVNGLQATGVSCGEAQPLASAWRRSSGCAASPGASHSACTVRGYRCIGTVTGRGLAVSCSRPGRAVSFTFRHG
jgi:hypothetical protein